MSWRIFRSGVLVVSAVLLLCVVTFYGVLYSYYENEIFNELENAAGYVLAGLETGGLAYLEALPPHERVTWVDTDGAVLYDNEAEASSMGNHGDREEIVQALETGKGRSSHVSATQMQKTMYCALRGRDGTVLRVARTHGSLVLLLLGTMRPILLVAALALVLSGVLASRLAQSIVRPINALDLTRPGPIPGYDELTPLVTRLRQQNMTIRKQMEALEAKQRDFSAILENMNEGVLLLDRKGGVLSSNRGFQRLLPAESERPAALRDAVEAALAGRRSEQTLELAERSCRVLASPVSENGHITGAVLLAMDVTEQTRREALRQEFSATVSHELKTPLTSISGFAELMMDGLAQPDKMREFSGDIYRESRRLITLVDDLLRLSRLDEGAPLLAEREAVDLYGLADDILENLRPLAEKRGVRLSLAGERAAVSGVWQLLNEMLYNLIDNAIKYNREGGSVTVTVSRRQGRAEVSVADSGIGIPYEQQSRVFERFYRVDKSHSRQLGGTGLGLSIVKHAAQHHGAALRLESAPGEGTTVTIQFQEEDTI